MMARTKHVQTSSPLARGDCASCGYPVATASVARLQADFSLLPDRLSLAMTELVTLGLNGQAALGRWGSSTSTVLETLAHVADTLSVMVVALEQPSAASAPAIDAPLAVDPALDSRDTVAVVARAAARLRSIASHPAAFDGRRLTHLWGREISLPELLRRAAHEGIHHLHEIELLLARATTPNGR
jgi:hypothetical protein